MSDFKLRKPTNKYYLFHKDYLEADRADLKDMAKEFAKTFGIDYEKMKIKGRYCSFSVDDSDYYGNNTITNAVETWLIIKWAEIYHSVSYYDSPHITTKSKSGGKDE